MGDTGDEPGPLDCDSRLYAMLLKTTMIAANADYLLWQMMRRGGSTKVAATYVEHRVVKEAKAVMSLFDFPFDDADIEVIVGDAVEQAMLLGPTGEPLTVARLMDLARRGGTDG